jgi:hypothetical protein
MPVALCRTCSPRVIRRLSVYTDAVVGAKVLLSSWRSLSTEPARGRWSGPQFARQRSFGPGGGLFRWVRQCSPARASGSGRPPATPLPRPSWTARRRRASDLRAWRRLANFDAAQARLSTARRFGTCRVKGVSERGRVASTLGLRSSSLRQSRSPGSVKPVFQEVVRRLRDVSDPPRSAAASRASAARRCADPPVPVAALSIRPGGLLRWRRVTFTSLELAFSEHASKAARYWLCARRSSAFKRQLIRHRCDAGTC